MDRLATARANMPTSRISAPRRILGLSGIEERLETVEAALPTLPSLLAEAQKLTNNEFASLNAVEKLLGSSPSLMARTLRIANSTLFAERGSVSTPAQAVARLGMRTIRSIILTEAMQSLASKSPAPHPLFNPMTLWEHSIATMCAARRLLAKCTAFSAEEEEISTAGLMHDMGRQALLRLVPEECKLIGEKLVQERAITPPEAEQAILGCTHEEVGALLARRWNLPQSLLIVIAKHNRETFTAETAWTPQLSEALKPAALIYVADCLAHQVGMGHRRGLHDQIAPRAIELIGLPPMPPAVVSASQPAAPPRLGPAPDAAFWNEARSGLHRDVAQARNEMGG